MVSHYRIVCACLVILLAWERGSEAVTVDLESAAELADTTLLMSLESSPKQPLKDFATQQAYRKYMAGLVKGMRMATPKQYPAEERILGEAAGGDGEVVARQIAFQKPTAQSSTDFGASADRAVDGNTDSDFKHGSCTSTHVQENPWWRVDLGNTRTVHNVEVWNRGDCCGARLSNFEVHVGDSLKWKDNHKCGGKWSIAQGMSLSIDCTGSQGRYVTIVIPGQQQALVLCEVKVTGSDYFGSNAALGKPTAQSSTKGSATSSRAVDGKKTNIFNQNSCTQTNIDNEPWWRVDLESPAIVEAVQLFNRGDCCGDRLSNAEVRVGDSEIDWTKNKMCGSRFSVPQGKMKSISCPQIKGRYVHVVIRDRGILTLCEVRVLTIEPKLGTNIARGKPTLQSSTQQGASASRAVDGNIDTLFSHGSCTKTHYDNEPWWRVDLEANQKVGGVQIWNRGDCCGARLSNFEVRVGESEIWSKNKQCGARHSVPQGRRKTIKCGGIEGRYVFVVVRGRAYLTLCEVRVLPFDGFTDGCASEPMGMESRKITDEAITASSTMDPQQHAAYNARLNYRGNTWTALYKKEGEWLQIALKEPTTISAIELQGSATSAEWVTKYKVQYFDGKAWQSYEDGKILDGSTDQITVQKTKMTKPFKATKVKILPTAWNGAISMRVELYGHTCKILDKEDADKDEKGCLVPHKPKCTDPEDTFKCTATKPTFLEINSSPGYGEGQARMWYAHDKGTAQSDIMGNSVYLDKSLDFRTQKGSIFAAKDLVAGRNVLIGAWPGYGTGSAQLRFQDKETGEEMDHDGANSVFLDNANLHIKDGSIISGLNVRAGKYLEIQAMPGHGAGVAQFWYSAVADEKSSADTLYLKSGDFKAETGSIVAKKNIVAGESLEIGAFPNYGTGKASLWYVQDGKGSYESNSVYLKNGDFRTEKGSIHAKQDLQAGRFLLLQSTAEYGLGVAKLWYAKDGKNGINSNTLYLDDANLNVHSGSISADKDVKAGRAVKIGAFTGFGSGSASFWYSQVGNDEFSGESLYLKGGDFRTQDGSIVSSKDITASRYLAVEALAGHGKGKAELFYSATARENYAANSLYLKAGDFRTAAGSIVSGGDLNAARYITIKALSGFGAGEANLWYSNKQQGGFEYNSLYLKAGDFRTEKGSIYAAKDVVAKEFLKIEAFPGYGQGAAELWYSQTGRDEYRSNTVYLTHGDLRTQAGSIHAALDVSVGRYLEIAAWPGHGSGVAQLWHGKSEDSADSSLYLKAGDFQTEAGSIISSKDITAGRYIEIGAKQGFGTGSAKLWYSRTGKGAVLSNTLHLQKGDFSVAAGSLVASADVKAGKNLIAKEIKVDYAAVKGAVTAAKLFLGKSRREESMLEATELLDVGHTQEAVDVGQSMLDLDHQLKGMSDTNNELRGSLEMLLGRLSAMESSL